MRLGQPAMSSATNAAGHAGANAVTATTGYTATGWTIFGPTASSAAPSATALFAAHGSFAAAAGAALFAVSTGPAGSTPLQMLGQHHGSQPHNYFEQAAVSNGQQQQQLASIYAGSPYYQLPPFLAPCSSSSTGIASSSPGGIGQPAIVFAPHQLMMASVHHQQQQPPHSCWALYSPEGPPGQASPPVSSVSLLDVVGGGGQRGGLKQEEPDYGGHTPITFHILTTHAVPPDNNGSSNNSYFVSSEAAAGRLHHQHQQIGGPSPHYQPVQHLHQQQQSPVIQVHSSSAAGSPVVGPHSFVLRQPPLGRQQLHQKSLSPDVSVDEECSGPGKTTPGGGDAGQPLQGHTARTPPETLDWLQANYEEFKGSSLPRCTLYEHYQNHCREAGLVPVNAASFGKLIRSVFKSLQTRRLGTRGNSKYHYNGIRVKPNSSLASSMSQEEFQRMNAPQQQPTTGGHQRNQRRQSSSGHGGGGPRRHRSTRGGGANSSSNNSSSDEQQTAVQDQQQPKSPLHYGPGQPFPGPDSLQQEEAGRPMSSRSGALPEVELPSLDEGLLIQSGLSLEHALKFFDDYREQGRKLLDFVAVGRLEVIERLWTAFWQGGQQMPEPIAEDSNGGGGDNGGELGHLRTICMDQQLLFRLCAVPPVLAFVQAFDLRLYQLLVDLLFVCPLRHSLPGELCNRVRHFGKSVECWMDKALGAQAPECLRRVKLGCVQLLAHSLTRLSFFAHLAITARNVLQNEAQVQQMHEDFNRVDFGVVHWQADWLCSGAHCPSADGWVRDLVRQFRDRLARRCSLDEWADWLESVADRALANWATEPAEVQVARSKRFLLGWTFHSSLLLRDITLRSAQSFGQFHLVRLLFDDFLLLCMERRLARLTGQQPIALMAPEWLRFGPADQQPPFPPPVPAVTVAQPATGQQQQHFYAQMQRQQQSSQFQLLPPPGPEPPLDMLNGTGEESMTRPREEDRDTAATTIPIRYVVVQRREGLPMEQRRVGTSEAGGLAETGDEDWEMVQPETEEDAPAGKVDRAVKLEKEQQRHFGHEE